jgi:hypothetical protein
MRVLCAWFPKLDIELILRQRPTLESRPVVLLQGHGDSALASGASCEASRLGILAGMSAGQARRRSPGAVFLADNSGACLDELERMARIVRGRATTRVAIGGRDHLFIAIDEANADEAKAVAMRVMGLVRAWAGHTVRGGLADSREEAFEAARASRRGLLVCPAKGRGDAGSIGPFREESIVVRQVSDQPLPGLAARATLGTLLSRLERVLAARDEGFRTLEVSVSVPEGKVAASGSRAQPIYSGSEAMQLVAAQLTPEALDGANGFEVTASRLAPDIRVRALGAVNFDTGALARAG